MKFLVASSIIFLIITLLFCIRVNFMLSYKDKFSFEIRWLFIKFNVSNEKPKKLKKAKKKHHEKKTPEKKPSSVSEKFKIFYENKGLSGFIELLHSFTTALSNFARRLLKSFCIKELSVLIKVAGGDAAATAEKYGKVCALIYPAFGTLCSMIKVKKINIDIAPNFLGEKDKIKFYCKAYCTPLRILYAAIIFILNSFITVVFKFIRGSRKTKEKRKVEISDERTIRGGNIGNSN